MKVHLFSDSAVVTYIKEYRQTPDTTDFVDEDHTDVFTRDAPGWHLCLTKKFFRSGASCLELQTEIANGVSPEPSKVTT